MCRRLTLVLLNNEGNFEGDDTCVPTHSVDILSICTAFTTILVFDAIPRQKLYMPMLIDAVSLPSHRWSLLASMCPSHGLIS